MVEEDRQRNIEDIEAAIVTGISVVVAVAVIKAAVEAEPMEQHNCCRVSVLDFLHEFAKHRDFLECSVEKGPDVCSG